jgi:hypothetical protein
MNSKVQNENQKKPKFPCLMINKRTNVIILFFQYTQGICVDPGQSRCIVGEHIPDVPHKDFEFFDGTVTLSNNPL